ncbi:hypothetical protein D5P88_07010 [Salmonella enterica subsp. enterica]|nr:hypothetical protein [Salmonella enterica subsp. enterica]
MVLNMKAFIWLIVKYNILVNYLAGKNLLITFIVTSALINSFPLVMFASAFLESYNKSPGYYDSSFIIGLFFQQCFFLLVMVFTLIEISKIKVKPLYQAFIFILLLILIKLLLSIYSYVSVGFSIDSIDFIREVTNSVRLWLYYYVLSWFCFTVVKISSQIKNE